jgi:AraC family transcriptional regulator of adaptative response/methylated-DNA-[protein]-cysteine methyltransferase
MENTYHGNIIERAIHFIVENYRSQPSLEEVSNHVHLSKYHFQRLFHEWAGVTPKQFLQYITVEHAKKCLKEGQSTLATAYEVGLSGNGRLHDMFIKIESCTPGEFQKRGEGLVLKYQVIDSPFGELVIAESDLGISQMEFLQENVSPIELLESIFPEAHFCNGLGTYGQMVKHYFSTWKIPERPIVLDLKGTPFQVSVWKALLSVPSAQFVAYGDIAKAINKPNAVRAVGTAVGKNPIAYLIPCHRVIRETGEMGGYGWGKGKKYLINGFENVQLSNKRIA